LSGIRYPRKIPKFKNIQILRINTKEIYKKGITTRINNCLEIQLESHCDAKLFSTILGHMSELEPSGIFSSDLLLDVLKNVNDLVRLNPPPPSKEEVIGAWGELKLLYLLLSQTSSSKVKKSIIGGWEANGLSRDIIDFRFPSLGESFLIEVKTSISERKHHINGFAQILVPENYSTGFLNSILIRETDSASGYSNKDLIFEIQEIFSLDSDSNEEFLTQFRKKLERRGIEICNDNRYFFQSNNDSFRFIDMNIIPKPIKTNGTENLEWTADVGHCSYVSLNQLYDLF